jgi:uncharacterized protein YbbC (DUF1343 family)/CubicO group peptidase (beta-lactamase class C family)
MLTGMPSWSSGGRPGGCWRLSAVALVAASFAVAPGATSSTVQTSSGVEPARLARLDRVVEDAIAARQAPGAVVLVGHGDEVVYRKAFGQRASQPVEPMTLDTVFDLASLTKVVATTTAVMTLVEAGRLRLSDPVSQHVPGFERHGKAGITVGHLLAHISGLRPDVDLADGWTGYDAAIELARGEVPVAAPGERFIYSDINFFVLGDIVRAVSGEALDAYARRVVFQPLGMKDTTFNPPAAIGPRIAPTERCDTLDAWPCKRPTAAPLRGIVHDPTARRMGGVAGHAGLFSTADDLSRFARMLLGRGTLEGVRVLSPLTVARMTSRATPSGMAAVRGLGWDIDTTYSANRGELFPVGLSYGHTGFTGTSLWIDPVSRMYVVFLSSRLYPDGVGDVTPLRARVATAAAAALVDPPTRVAPSSDLLAAPGSAPPPAAAAPVLAGVDVLARDGFAPIKGKRVGLLTNHTGIDRTGLSTIDILRRAPGVTLVSLFSPEHGIRGILDEDVPSSRDDASGLPIHSLYGETRRPTAAMLDGLDAMVVDLQDIGARFYTYQASLGYLLEEAAARRLAVIVLDRPNPIDGWHVEGPFPDASATGFIAYYPMPVRHGMTLGELAKLFNGEKKLGVDLTVVPAANWKRDVWFDETSLRWVNPSPNVRNLTAAALYPGVGAIEYSNVSVGRGTDQPFERVGAPWIDGAGLAAALNARKLPGVRFYPEAFTPSTSKYAGEPCQGIHLIVTDRAALQPVRVGLEIAAALLQQYPTQYRLETTERLLGSRESLARVARGEDPAIVAASWAADEAKWRQVRARYLIYK